MRSCYALGLAAALLAAIPAVSAAAIVPLDSLNHDNATGVSIYAGNVLTVTGTVTCQDSIFSPTGTDDHIQDGSGGAVDLFGGLQGLAFGDSVQVTGQVTTFNGLTEITNISNVTHLGPASVIPAPLVLTCAQVASSYQAGNYEPNQSKLVRINGVHLTAGTWPTSHGTTNVTLTIADASGATTLFIDKDTQVNGSPNPGSVFDIEGVVRQFKSTSPFTSGYELVPRYLSDVIPYPGPVYSQTPTVLTIDSLTTTIIWSTTGPTTSTLHYGPTTSYGNTITDGQTSTTHQVTITGLTPRSLYHMYAEASDGLVTNNSPDAVFITWPSPGTPGDVTVYFNQTVNNSVACDGCPPAQGTVACDQKLVDLIGTAQTTIDCALYSFSLQNVVNALITAKNRGVAIRLILDASNSQSYALQLQSAGVPFINSTFGGNHSDGSIMHSKYVAIDAKAAEKDSAKVWTGSWNCSVSGQGDAQNVIILRDWGLAQAYTMDFEQMWGSSTQTANAANSRMGNRKSEVIPHQYLVGGRRVECYMSPSDHTESHLIQYMQMAQHNMLFAMLTFTSSTLSHAMKVHRDSLTDDVFKVRGLFDPSSVDASSQFCKLDGQVSCSDFWSPRADVFQDNSTAFDLLHHKYAIFDNNDPTTSLWTGSHNWSNAANNSNDENSVIVHDVIIANQYYQEWYQRYVESGGQLAGVGGDSRHAAVTLSQSRPNPTHDATTIAFTLPVDQRHVSLGIYDLGGRLIRELVSGPLSAGNHEARWNGRTTRGTPAPAGLYFYRLTTDQGMSSKRLVLAH